MKIKYEDLLKKINILTKMGNKQMGIKASYYMTKNINNINAELKIFDEQKNRITNEFAEKNNDGNLIVEEGKYVFKDDNLEKCNEKYNELLNLEIEIDIIKISIEWLDGVTLSPNELLQLDFMIGE